MSENSKLSLSLEKTSKHKKFIRSAKHQTSSWKQTSKTNHRRELIKEAVNKSDIKSKHAIQSKFVYSSSSTTGSDEEPVKKSSKVSTKLLQSKNVSLNKGVKNNSDQTTDSVVKNKSNETPTKCKDATISKLDKVKQRERTEDLKVNASDQSDIWHENSKPIKKRVRKRKVAKHTFEQHETISFKKHQHKLLNYAKDIKSQTSSSKTKRLINSTLPLVLCSTNDIPSALKKYPKLSKPVYDRDSEEDMELLTSTYKDNGRESVSEVNATNSIKCKSNKNKFLAQCMSEEEYSTDHDLTSKASDEDEDDSCIDDSFEKRSVTKNDVSKSGCVNMGNWKHNDTITESVVKTQIELQSSNNQSNELLHPYAKINNLSVNTGIQKKKPSTSPIIEKKTSTHSLKSGSSKDHVTMLPVMKPAGLPIIKITQGADYNETREIAFKPMIANLDEAVDNFDDSCSNNSSLASTIEDFTEFLTSMDVGWTEVYDYEEHFMCRITSNDSLFEGAKLNIENLWLINYDQNTQNKKPNTDERFELELRGSSCHNIATVPIEERECSIQTEMKSLVSQVSNPSRTLKNKFRKPVLPPAKRPPGRSKGSISPGALSYGSIYSPHQSDELMETNSIKSRLTISTLENDTVLENSAVQPASLDDDVISIYAESIINETINGLNAPHNHAKLQNEIKTTLNSNTTNKKLNIPTNFVKFGNEVTNTFNNETSTRLSVNHDFIKPQTEVKDTSNRLKFDSNKLEAHTSKPQTESKSTPNVEPFNRLNVHMNFVTSQNENKNAQQTVSSQNRNSDSIDPGFLLPQEQEKPQESAPSLSTREAEKVPKPLLSLSTGVPSNNNEVVQWASTDHCYRVKQKIDFSKVPYIFKHLCYYHFTFGSCFAYIKKGCLRPHILKKNDLNKIKKLSLNQLLPSYAYVKVRRTLFCEAFGTFVEAFQEHKAFELINLLDDILENVEYDKDIYVEKLINGLLAQGQIFGEVIEDIMFREGSKNVEILNILLNVTCNRPELLGNWTLVKRLLKYRKSEFMDYKILEAIINQCLITKNPDLCKKVINDVVSCYKVELDYMDQVLLQNFYTVLRSLFLQNEAEFLQNTFRLHHIVSSNHSMPNLLMKEQTTRNFIQDNFNQGQSHIDLQTCNQQNYETNVANALEFDQARNILKRNSLEIINSCNRAESNNSPVLAFTPILPPLKNFSDATPTFFSSTLSPNESSFINTSCHNSRGCSIFSNTTVPLAFPSSNNSMLGISNTSSAHSIPSSTQTRLNIPQQNLSPPTKTFEIPDKVLSYEELKELREVTIKRASIVDFMRMLNKYKDTPYSRSFLLNTIVLFKNHNVEETTNFFKGIFTRFNALSDKFYSVKHMMRILCVNIIGALDGLNAYEEAADILSIYFNDIHSLINVDWLSTHKHTYSSIAKYVYFCKIFTKGRHYELAFKLFTSPELKLLQGHQSWPLPNIKNSDLPFRNSVLQEFILVTLRNNLRIAMDIIVYMLTEKSCISDISIWKYFNMLINNMVEYEYTYLRELQSMLPTILEGWHRHLTNSVLRGLLTVLVPHSLHEDMENLYLKCCIRGIYHKITGGETSIIFTTNLTCEEIYLIFKIYLYKIKQTGVINDLSFDILLTPSESEAPTILTKAIGSVQQMKIRIYKVLAKCFNRSINTCLDDEEPSIKIKRDELKTFLYTYRDFNLSNRISIKCE